MCWLTRIYCLFIASKCSDYYRFLKLKAFNCLCLTFLLSNDLQLKALRWWWWYWTEFLHSCKYRELGLKLIKRLRFHRFGHICSWPNFLLIKLLALFTQPTQQGDKRIMKCHNNPQHSLSLRKTKKKIHNKEGLSLSTACLSMSWKIEAIMLVNLKADIFFLS